MATQQVTSVRAVMEAAMKRGSESKAVLSALRRTQTRRVARLVAAHQWAV